jgi:2-(1,2-epoxy-1,2-dihydrophenyl)acetyl-CoA isomerase
MAYQTILMHAEGGVARITLNRPDRRNAINRAMIAELQAALTEAHAESAVRAVILDSAGEAFSAGGDIGDHHETFALPHEARRASVAAALDALGGVVHLLLAGPKPVVAAVRGPCIGAAVGLAAAADVVIATNDARFQLAQTGLGLAIDGGTSYLLPRLIGLRASQRLALFGDAVDAAEAAQLGLVTQIVDVEALVEASGKAAGRLAAQPPGGVMRSKALLLGNLDRGPRAALSAESRAVVDSFLDPAFAERVQAFLTTKRSR